MRKEKGEKGEMFIYSVKPGFSLEIDFNRFKLKWSRRIQGFKLGRAGGFRDSS